MFRHNFNKTKELKMKRPTTQSGYTKEDLKEYALYRKDEEFKTIKSIQDQLNSGGIKSVEDSEDYQEPLSLDVEKVVKIQLSYGGDGDGFELTFDRENNLISGVYYWEDWGVYEEVDLSEDELDKIYAFYLYSDISILS